MHKPVDFADYKLYYFHMSLPNDKIVLDSVDRKIMAALREDGSVALAKIAEDLGVSPGMIRLRYNRLVETGILKVVAISNPLRMGFKTMALIGIRVDVSRLPEIAEKISQLDEVIYLIITSGRYDLFAEVMTRDHADLLNFLTHKLSSIDGLRESESFMHLKIVKEVYF